MNDDLLILVIISLSGFLAMALFVARGWALVREWWIQIEKRVDVILNKQLLLDFEARIAMIVVSVLILAFTLIIYLLLESMLFASMAFVLACFTPWMVVSHLETKRRKKLDEQIVDGITTLASGVRAGLTLVQAFELLGTNASGPIKQETQQMLREYELGVDLHEAMRNTANRIGSPYYRLLFSAIEAHRKRGGDIGESLDRIADSVREIQRLEGRLDALTAQGRAQATFMAIAPFGILAILYVISPEDTGKLFYEPMGRLILLIAVILIVVAWMWIRRIMQVEM